MFDVTELKSIEFELANKCNARCPQCPRYSNGRLITGLNKHELFLNDIKKSIAVATIKNLSHVTFKGTTGDPIIARDFLSILTYFKEINPSIKVWIATNGGLHEHEYWQRLAGLLSTHDTVVFGIDGLEDTHHIYRIGTEYHTVIENAKTFIQAGGNAHWQFIKFKHNEHQWTQCQETANQLGFTNFITLHSDRNFAQTELYPASDYVRRQPTGCISCQSWNKKEVFVYADGTVYPCCFLGGMHAWSSGTEAETDYSMLTKLTDPTIMKIPDHTLEEVIASQQHQNFAQVFQTPLRHCKKYCS